MKTFQPVDVVCALIFDHGQLLIVQHGPSSHHPGKWEFPGGKVQTGESQEEALRREILEELETEVTLVEKLDPVTFTYPGKTIRLIPFLCTLEAGKMSLKEHIQLSWVNIQELENYDLLPADREMAGLEANFQKLVQYAVSNSG